MSRRSRQFLNACSLALCLLFKLADTAVAAPPSPAPSPQMPQGSAIGFCHIAREYVGAPGLFDGDIAPALSEDHKVAFVASLQSNTAVKRAHVGDGTYLDTIDLPAAGLSDPAQVKINAGALGVIATRKGRGIAAYRGVYTTSLASLPSVAFQTLHETFITASPSEPLMTSNKTAPLLVINGAGQVAFSSIRDGQGNLYRGPVLGPVSVLRPGSGTFFNLWELDFNTADTVSANMEYFDETSGMGLTYGVVNFSDPTQSDLHNMQTPLEHVGLGNNTHGRSNNLGQVVFIINNATTGKFFTPPDVWSSTPTTVITLAPGIYKAESKPWGQPWLVTKLVDTSGPYASFSAVDINDQGLVVFQATLDSGGSGVFFGPDPSHQNIVLLGDVFQGRRFSQLKMGELNNQNELSLMTVDFATTDRELWRISIKPGLVTWPTVRGLISACTQ